MGAGKSTICKLIANELGWPYFDNDSELAMLSGLNATELSQLGVEELHRLESRCLEEISERPGPFIAGAAASVVDFEESLKILNGATSIYLRIPLEKLDSRAGSNGIGRGNIEGYMESVLRDRFLRRDPICYAVSKLIIDVGTSPLSDAKTIVSFLKKRFG